MEGGYFSVSHKEVNWVNIECGSHSGCGMPAFVTVHVTHVCILLCMSQWVIVSAGTTKVCHCECECW